MHKKRFTVWVRNCESFFVRISTVFTEYIELGIFCMFIRIWGLSYECCKKAAIYLYGYGIQIA